MNTAKLRKEIWWLAIVATLVAIVFVWWNGRATGGTYTVHGGAKDLMSATTPSGSAVQTAAPARATDVAAIAASISNASEFTSLLMSTGVGKSITSGGPYTLFVLTDTALHGAGVGSMTAMQKKRFVQYHIIVGRAVDTDAMRAGSVAALSGDLLNFTVASGSEVRVNSSAITKTVSASNGVVYVINAPLFPPNKAW